MEKFIQTYARDGHALKAIAYCIRHMPCSYNPKITSNLWMWGNAFFFFNHIKETHLHAREGAIYYIYIYIYIYI
jgi:hypothetical protein